MNHTHLCAAVPLQQDTARAERRATTTGDRHARAREGDVRSGWSPAHNFNHFCLGGRTG
eukprot:CAMPEP_0206028634 /NCGR_PEP_ID=MMETSP1464-20131121/45271_1 /ASSEMBLY_ACC=CAM_ASM_001124 /TAXON_ID=119497 /ORGANISM="Exanthemachrysis gayraliae, Strain RCC1523" /LENGTH=58 /DNA_ID=CAMNT_0053402705 /DNA_START=233 /DNA_END=406 /DNA_ORIENTATION=-